MMPSTIPYLKDVEQGQLARSKLLLKVRMRGKGPACNAHINYIAKSNSDLLHKHRTQVHQYGMLM